MLDRSQDRCLRCGVCGVVVLCSLGHEHRPHVPNLGSPSFICTQCEPGFPDDFILDETPSRWDRTDDRPAAFAAAHVPTPARSMVASAQDVIATVWASVTEPQGRRVHISRADVIERFRIPVVAANKRALAGWAPTRFRNDVRSLANVEVSYAIGFDVDAEGTQSDLVAIALDGYAGFIYTSYRHTPEAHRLRAIIWLSRPISADEYGRCWRHVARRLPTVGEAAKDPSRLWFVPGVPPGGEDEYRLVELVGDPLDVDEALRAEPTEEAHALIVAPTSATSTESRRLIERASAYLAQMSPSISGSNGHWALWSAAFKLVCGFGLSGDDALALLIVDFNPRCLPIWSIRELNHKVDDAVRSREGRPLWLADSSLLIEEGASQWGGSFHATVRNAGYDPLPPRNGRAELHQVRLGLVRSDGVYVPAQFIVLPIGGQHENARAVFDATLAELGPPEAWLDPKDSCRLATLLLGGEFEVVLPPGARRASRMRRSQ